MKEVVAALASGWLTSGPRVARFEKEFAAAVGARFAVAVNSGTAALHLAVEAVGLRAGEGVLVPTMTFAATAEVVCHRGAFPILVDCEPATGNLDLADAERRLDLQRQGRLPRAIPRDTSVTGVMPVHLGGFMMDPEAVSVWAEKRRLWVVEDAAHAFLAASRTGAGSPWRRCGEGTAAITCFSFYANKPITTGEGGMATTMDEDLAAHMRMMSLHGLSANAWQRYAAEGDDGYQILMPGYKYNLTDVAAAIGIHQLARAEELRRKREAIAQRYFEAFAELEEVELPARSVDRVHSWHLFPIRLFLPRLSIDRDRFLREIRDLGVRCQVHWRPLHLHPYYRETFGWSPEDFPVATALWERLVSLPIFPGMTKEETDWVIHAVRKVCRLHRGRGPAKRLRGGRGPG